MRDKLSAAALLFALTLPAAAAVEAGKPSFEIYGFGQVDVIQDLDRVNPAWDATLRPSRIPTAANQFGSDKKATISARQSRLGAQGNLTTDHGDVYAKFEFDMFGVGADEGLTTIRLRHAYGQWGQFLGGQTHSLFMDVDVFPSVLDYWGPTGMAFLRLPQFRWTPIRDRDLFGGKAALAFAAEHPSSDIDSGRLREFDPALGANVQPKQKLPDFTAQLRGDMSWGHVQLASIFRQLGYETINPPSADPSDYNLGWGVDLTSSIKTFGKSKLFLSFIYGEGIASYMNDGGNDIAPKSENGQTIAQSLPLGGLMAYYDHWWNDKWSSTGGWSLTQVENTNLQTATSYHSGQYASGNLVYHPNSDTFFGLEFLWGQRKDVSGAKGTDRRFQFSAHYNFSTNQLFSKLNP